MTKAMIEERLVALEQKVARLTKEQDSHGAELPWWETISGTFADSPDYEEAMKLGRAYRESLRPLEESNPNNEK